MFNMLSICLFSWVVFILADNFFPGLPFWLPNFSLITSMPLWPKQWHRLHKLNYTFSFSMLSEFTLALLSIVINNFALPFPNLTVSFCIDKIFSLLILHLINDIVENYIKYKEETINYQHTHWSNISKMWLPNCFCCLLNQMFTNLLNSFLLIGKGFKSMNFTQSFNTTLAISHHLGGKIVKMNSERQHDRMCRALEAIQKNFSFY